MAESGEELGVRYQAINICTWVLYGVLCHIINVFGVVTNIINIICFTKQGFQDSVNISLTGLAVSDCFSLLSMMWTCISLTPGMATADLPFDAHGVMYLTSAMTHLCFTRVSSCITAMITLERCLCITAPLKIKAIYTTRRATVITVSIFIIFFWSASPVWAVNRLGQTFSAKRNRTIIGVVSTTNREEVEAFSFAINNFFIPFVAFIIIVVCTTILSFKLRRAAEWRLKTITNTQGAKVSRRNQRTARMVVMVSNLFIVCFIPVTLVMLMLVFLPEFGFGGKDVDIAIAIAGFGYILENCNSSLNIFIYYRMSSRYRESFLKIFFKGRKLSNEGITG